MSAEGKPTTGATHVANTIVSVERKHFAVLRCKAACWDATRGLERAFRQNDMREWSALNARLEQLAADELAVLENQ